MVTNILQQLALTRCCCVILSRNIMFPPPGEKSTNLVTGKLQKRKKERLSYLYSPSTAEPKQHTSSPPKSLTCLRGTWSPPTRLWFLIFFGGTNFTSTIHLINCHSLNTIFYRWLTIIMHRRVIVEVWLWIVYNHSVLILKYVNHFNKSSPLDYWLVSLINDLFLFAYRVIDIIGKRL